MHSREWGTAVRVEHAPAMFSGLRSSNSNRWTGLVLLALHNVCTV